MPWHRSAASIQIYCDDTNFKAQIINILILECFVIFSLARWEIGRRSYRVDALIHLKPRSVTLLRMLVSFLIDAERKPGVIDRNLRGRVRVEQIDVALRLAPFTVMTTVSVVQVIVVLFWQAGNKPYLAGLEAIVLAIAAFALQQCWHWRSNPQPHEVDRRFVNKFVWITFLSGLLLASIPLMLFVDTDLHRRLLIASTCAGLIATSITVAVVPLAAISFSGPLILGSFIALAMAGEPLYAVVAVLLAIYAAFIFLTMIHLGRLVTMRVISQVELERQQELTSLLLNDFEENASDWLWETDATLRLQHISARLVQVAGSSDRKLKDLPLEWLIQPSIADEDADSASAFWSHITHRRAFRDVLLPVEIAGERRWWSLSGKPIFNRSRTFVGYRGVGSDVTQKKLAEERLSHLATHDALTNLPNRLLFQQNFNFVRHRRNDLPGYAILCLDLDGFKGINDSFGHAAGDALLQAVARRLCSFTDPNTLVSRLAGDEFAILVTGRDRDAISDLAAQLVEAVGVPYCLGEIQTSVGVSIGIATSAEGGFEEIMRHADVALYRMKHEGRNGFRFYEAEMDERTEERRALSSDLRGALDRGEFFLHFQPLVAAHTSIIQGFEALLRWRHPVHGCLSPKDFIPLAEETGTIIPLGQWLIQEACRVAATWPSDLSVAVNLSPTQFRHSDLLAIVENALQESGLAAQRLELEITEAVFLEATARTHAMLRKLRKMNIRLSLDDFGTGYSSLSYLRRIPFHKIKIDRSFVRDLPQVATDVAIIHAILELGNSLGMTITAEGVETEAQRICLLELGCHQFQGYLFSRPLPIEELDTLIKKPRLSLADSRAA